jgi:hypothetical protein
VPVDRDSGVELPEAGVEPVAATDQRIFLERYAGRGARRGAGQGRREVARTDILGQGAADTVSDLAGVQMKKPP